MGIKLMEPTVESVGARSQMRRGRSARTRLSKVANARDTIEGFDRDTDLVGLTYGQFSLLDLVDAERFGFFSEFVEACWLELPEGSTGDRTLPGLPGLVSVQPRVSVEMGAPVAVGLWDQ